MVVEVSSTSMAIGIPSGVSSRALVGLSMFSAIATATTRKPEAMEAKKLENYLVELLGLGC